MTTLPSFLGAMCSTAVLVIATYSPLQAQTVLRTVDFEDYPVGPGELDGPYDGALVFVGSGDGRTDPIQGVVESSPIGTGKAGYIGAPSNVVSDFVLDFVYFPGNLSDPVYAAAGTDKAFVYKQIDFSIDRVAANPVTQIFFFYSVSFAAADGSGFGTHASVILNPDNSLSISDNPAATPVSTGVVVENNIAYRLGMSLDYNTKSWSAVLQNLATSSEYSLADGRSMETDGYVVGDFTKTEELDVEMLALGYNGGTAQLADILYIDNFSSTAIPEPSACALLIGVFGLLRAGVVRRGRPNQCRPV